MKTFTEMPPFVISFIQKQHMFWVATAPLSADGHVNLSPKGLSGTFHIKDENTVWYEDMTGSGVETIAHLRENGRMTIMFCAFEGPPQIVRLHGRGKVYEYDSSEYNKLIPLNERQPGSRSVIMLHIHRVGTSCGFSVPFYTFKGDRMRLHQYCAKSERADLAAADASQPSLNGLATSFPDEIADNGVRRYWAVLNKTSIDGLPGIQDAHKSKTLFDRDIANKEWKQESLSRAAHQQHSQHQTLGVTTWVDPKLLVVFVLGALTTGLWRNIIVSLFQK
uniref:Pyridoxamine 5'-phosphate oxidase N-terminal domain-containing protein n=2 Tax=Psilocybe cubensis TaxID=181762 RepID=A0A8H8CIF0_PSICU